MRQEEICRIEYCDFNADERMLLIVIEKIHVEKMETTSASHS
jgi:hypothetical protein